MKDIDIILNERKGFNQSEWHFLNGVDEEALEFVKKYTSDRNLLNNIKIFIY